MSIDLVVVDIGSKKPICYAPFNTVNVGDTVIIGSETGTVVATMYTYTENEVIKFFSRNMDIIPVKAVIKKINYEGVEI